MVDATLSIHPEMLHGGRRPTVEWPWTLDGGDDYNVSRWTISAHAGTHVEAPLHTVAGGAAIDALPLETFVGPARVLDLTSVTTEITAADLLAAGLGDESRVLLKTANSTTVLLERDKAEHWIGVAPDAAALLVERGVRVLGVDYLTIEAPAREATFDAHYVLNGAGVALIESLDLAEVSAGLVELICPPVLLDAEAAPARALIRPLVAGEGGGQLIDVSIPVRERMLTWGKAPQRIVVESLDGGNMCNVTRWTIGTHTGSHVDAPLHYSAGQPAIDAMPLEVFHGRAQVLDLTGVAADVTAADLEAAGLGDAPRVLLKTRNSGERLLHGDAKPEAWIGIAEDAAALLVQRGAVLVGLDFLSIEGVAESAGGWAAHHVMCDAGLALLEAVDLAGVEAGEYELFALPLPLSGAEAAPARVFLRTLA
ncbi:cyclase family protein [Conexibacter sp. JD483]|uniref:cyclase family protein n=1 Tax=unclassified Conexibacter TaxID=2627773 RepID=UPI002724CCD9|nr:MULTISPECIES: cyclase family protein [unclassified Conexibacter]MDO8188477.1 cyclase family protein [Conexibacter sp. CPCC 205706]MDO8201447.1 cyclase family protein [Conexibacter sp. CPCC 205762]MDR9371753.1 cyclase family protein [Conexibacter sp. JD483]